jgi:hypothetical protein
MSLFEIIGEWIAPAPAGSLGLHPRARQLPSTAMVMGRAAVSIVSLAALLVYLGLPNGMTGVAVCLGYVFLATVLRPEPDLSNVGWFGGLVDHPFRITDDINRFLIFLLLAFWPGRIVGGGFLLLLRWLVTASRAAR